MKKKMILIRVMVCVFLGIFVSLNSYSQERKKPNVLFIAIDDMRPELACFGKSQIISPNIDKLASEGTVFTRAYCQQAVCGPSRLSIMTGVRPETLGVFGMSASNIIEWRDTRKGITSLSEQFRNNGYYAIGFGKIYDYRLGYDEAYSWDEYQATRIAHFASPQNLAIDKQRLIDRKAKKDNPQRWSAVECYDTPDETYMDGRNADLAIDFLKKQNDKPFFLAVGFVRPHLPFVAPKKYWDLYKREDIELPAQNKPLDGFSGYTLSPYKEIFDYDVCAPVSMDVAKELRHGYYACISYVDAQIGKLVKALENKGELENTIIVIWGDHGFKLGEYGEWAKHTNLEIDTRVPLIFRMPNQKNTGVKSMAMVELIDVLPTLCEAAQIEVPESAQGKSLLPIIQNQTKKVKDYAISQFPRGKDVMGYSIRTSGWRYSEWISRSSGQILQQELYLLDEDGELMETENVADKYRKQVKLHSEILHQYLKNTKKWNGETVG